MKKYLVALALMFSLFSCKDAPYMDPDEPDWLKQRIQADEEIIKSNPQSGLDAAAWLRFEWQGGYYFDYINPANSSGIETYNFKGELIPFATDGRETYEKDRCCEHVVWTGSKYVPTVE
ncbi:MAG TPA: hypothetical protein VHO46_09215 [Bacteroidales bacterium]|nr:hypothetical protein [Bacteroidales bacterium]